MRIKYTKFRMMIWYRDKIIKWNITKKLSDKIYKIIKNKERIMQSNLNFPYGWSYNFKGFFVYNSIVYIFTSKTQHFCASTL